MPHRHSIAKEFAKYASLNILGMVGMSCYILADTFFIAAALGADGLAALNFCISVFSVLQGFGLMLGMGGATRYAILKNSGDQARANAVLTHALAAGGLLAVGFVGVGIWASRPLAGLLGAQGDVLALSTVYLTTILAFAPCFLLNNILIAFVRNDNSPQLAMAAMLVSSLSNIVLDYLFIFPLGMGMFGAAFATGLSPVISLGVLSLHLRHPRRGLRFVRYRLTLARLWDLVSLGLSSFVTELASAVALITFNLVILSIQGNIGVAAYGVVANIALIATSIFTGLAQGMQPLASRGQGLGDTAMVRRVLGYSRRTALLLAVGIWAVTGLGAAAIVEVFNSNHSPQLAALATQGMRLYFPGYLFAGQSIVTAAFLSATAQPKAALWVSLLRSCLVPIPLLLLLASLLGMPGVWLSFVATEGLVCLVGTVLLGKTVGLQN